MGAWIEILQKKVNEIEAKRRTPRWVRGLKLDHIQCLRVHLLSHPTMGAWIEIVYFFSS